VALCYSRYRELYFHLAVVVRMPNFRCFGSQHGQVVVEEKEEKALETPRADPEKQDYCWTEKFPSELGVEMHASKILNRDAEGVFSKF